jgi:hypothetical protein
MRRAYFVRLLQCLTTSLLLSSQAHPASLLNRTASLVPAIGSFRAEASQSQRAKRQLPPEVNPPGMLPRINPGVRPAFDDAAQGTNGPIFVSHAKYNSGGAAPSSLAVADLNGDGKPDEVVLNQCTTGNNGNCSGPGVVSVRLGNGDGTFQAAQTYNSGGYFAIQVAVADMNGDGKLDLVVLNLCLNFEYSGSTDGGSIAILLGNGDGTFQAAQSLTIGNSPSSMAVGDVNRDGKTDLIVSYFCDVNANECSYGAVDVYLGIGDGTFQTPVDYSSGGYVTEEVILGDMNGDGNPDLLVANCGSPDCFIGTVGVLVGNGDGTFQAAQTYNSGGVFAMAVTVGDVNGDGKLDLVVDNDCLSPGFCNEPVVSVLLGNGDGTLQPAQAYLAGGYGCSNSGYCPVSIALADVDGDGKLDVVAPFNVLFGNGDGTFQSPVAYSTDSCRRGQFAVADLNGDGKPDVSIANYFAKNGCGSTGLTILLNVSTLPTTTSLVSSPNPALILQTITFTATVSSPYVGVVGGSVAFESGGASLGSGLVVNGQANLSTSFSTSGIHFVTAKYLGDANNAPSNSPALKQVVNKNPSSTTIFSDRNPSTFGQSLLFTALVTGSGAPTGTVTFKSGGTLLGTEPLTTSGSALPMSAFPAGTHIITAIYSGDPTFDTSTSKLTQVVNKASTAESLTSSQDPSALGHAVTFTATVTSSAGVPTGTVIFKNGATILDSVALSGGVATFATSTLPAGSNKITAHYGGVTNYSPSSNSLTQVVQ